MDSACAGVDPRFLDFVVCLRDYTALRQSANQMIREQGHAYGIVDGVPVLLVEEVEFTHCAAQRALAATRTESPKLTVAPVNGEIDPWVNQWIASTNGALYSHLQGKLREYPIPNLRLPPGNGRVFLEVGCIWGRWCACHSRVYFRLAIKMT